MKKVFYVVALMGFLLACSSEKPGTVNTQGPVTTVPGKNNTPAATLPQASTAGAAQGSIEVLPVETTKNSILNLIVRGTEPAKVKVMWLVNGMPVENNSGFQFNTANVKKGDTVQAKAIVQDRDILSNVVPIRNSPPELISARFIMNDPSNPGKLSVDVAGKDADGDAVTFLYEWTNNQAPAGKGKTIDSSIKRGDKISVKIVPFDGEAYGRPIILTNEVRNLPPVFIEDSRVNFDGHVWTTQIKASDPDGDTLTYSIKDAPPGMTINPATGGISWNVPPEFTGKASFTVSVNDGHGGETVKPFHFEITQAKGK